jgi:GGDEF domain-containing protein
MQAAPIPSDESTRLHRLHGLQIMDTAAEERFDRITRLSARMFDVPMAMLSFVDADRQWLKSAVGVSISSLPRGQSLCAHSILRSEPTVVPDACRDDRFATHPWVAGDPGIRFYAGAPLLLERGSAVGTLCILDRLPRGLAGIDIGILQDLAALVVRELRSGEPATPDTLTGLLRRQTFEEVAQRALKICERAKTPAVLCAFRLSPVFGGAGCGLSLTSEPARIAFAEKLRQSFRSSDVLGCAGEDCFVVLATQSSASEVNVALERLRKAVACTSELVCAVGATALAGAAYQQQVLPIEPGLGLGNDSNVNSAVDSLLSRLESHSLML